MKKIYSLLLLGGLLLLGAQNAEATHDYIIGLDGNWSSVNSSYKFDYSDSPGSFSVVLNGYTSYNFKFIQTDDDDKNWVWYGNTGTITESVENWDFKKAVSGNCTLSTKAAGTYTFSIVWSNYGEDYYYPRISVTYPNGVTYTVSYDNSTSNWSNVYAYIYSSDESVRIVSDWHGKEATLGANNLYTLTFESAVIPAKIIWNTTDTGEGAKQYPAAGGFTFTDGAVYNTTGVNTSFSKSINVTSAGWASLYLPYPAIVPANVTAYYANPDDVSGTSVTLTAITSGSIIPANTGVVIKAAAGSYAFTYSSESPATVTKNLLSGTNSEISKSAEGVTYVLSGTETTPTSCVFAPFSGASLAAYKAYIHVEDAYSAPSIRFIIGGATDIQNFEASEIAMKFIENGRILIKKNGIVYDALGRIVK